jgi:hypothetical protein
MFNTDIVKMGLILHKKLYKMVVIKNSFIKIKVLMII